MQSCLNWLQLSNNQQMVDLADPAKNLKFAGTLKNPISPPSNQAPSPQGACITSLSPYAYKTLSVCNQHPSDVNQC
jgi:hypothetical protein